MARRASLTDPTIGEISAMTRPAMRNRGLYFALWLSVVWSSTSGGEPLALSRPLAAEGTCTEESTGEQYSWQAQLELTGSALVRGTVSVVNPGRATVVQVAGAVQGEALVASVLGDGEDSGQFTGHLRGSRLSGTYSKGNGRAICEGELKPTAQLPPK